MDAYVEYLRAKNNINGFAKEKEYKVDKPVEKRVFGFKFLITEKGIEKVPAHSDLASATVKAYREIDKYEDCEDISYVTLKIIVNEAARDRLDLEDMKAILEINRMIRDIHYYGMSSKSIIILRSIGYPFEEIVKLARRKKTVEQVFEDEGLENPDIEAVVDITTKDMEKEYVPYSEVKGL